MSSFVTGPDYDEDGPDEFRPVPHPDDRLWRHPSEIAAMHAAHANAETAKVPAIVIDVAPKSRVHMGLVIAAGVAVVGAAALTLGVVSTRTGSTSAQVASQVAGIAETDETDSASIDTQNETTDVIAETSAQGEGILAVRIHDQIAMSLPRIQAATSTGMREGSGLFVTSEGHIATSAGLIEDADYILAWTDDDQRWKAHVLASDPVSDIAIIQIDSEDWPAVSLGTGDDLRNGQYALALDHENHSISIGEVTDASGALIEVDQPAALPGSAIVDDTGAVIAMVTADGTNNYATPAWMVENVSVDLISSGQTTHIWLGVVVEDTATDDMVIIRKVMADSPAAAAGLRVDDLIDSFNGDPVFDAASLHHLVQSSDAHSEAVLTVTRNGSRRIILATLDYLRQ